MEYNILSLLIENEYLPQITIQKIRSTCKYFYNTYKFNEEEIYNELIISTLNEISSYESCICEDKCSLRRLKIFDSTHTKHKHSCNYKEHIMTLLRNTSKYPEIYEYCRLLTYLNTKAINNIGLINTIFLYFDIAKKVEDKCMPIAFTIIIDLIDFVRGFECKKYSFINIINISIMNNIRKKVLNKFKLLVISSYKESTNIKYLDGLNECLQHFHTYQVRGLSEYIGNHQYINLEEESNNFQEWCSQTGILIQTKINSQK